MNSKKIWWIILGAIVIAAGYSVYRSEGTLAAPQIDSFKVVRPDFVITGNNLVKVEVWGIPTGTEITEAQYVPIGEALFDTASPGTWKLAIPAQEMLLSGIFAKGYGPGDTEPITKDLALIGATEIYDALWATSTATTTGSGASTTSPAYATSTVTLSVGEKKDFAEVSMRLVSVLSDSRCPADVTCIQAGDVTASIELSSDTRKETVNIREGQVLSFRGYTIRITFVTPYPQAGRPIPQKDYRITFSLTRP